MNSQKIAVTGEQFGITNAADFEAMVGTYAQAHHMDIECSCGVCHVGPEVVADLTKQRRLANLPTEDRMRKLFSCMQAEWDDVFTAACASVGLVEAVENRLRG